MAAITTAGSGNWNSTTPNAPWPSGVVPTSADAVTIAAGNTVTLDTTGCACLSLSIAATGVLACSAAATSSLTVQKGIAVTSGNTAIPYQLDLSSTPTYSCTIKINASNSATAADQIMSLKDQCGCTIKGYPRNRKTTLTTGISIGATSAVVGDASGWQIGDKIIFATTSAYATTPAHDEVTLTSVSGVSIGWTGGTAYPHGAGGYVGNFTSNMVFTEGAAGVNACFCWDHGYPADSAIQQKTIDNVLIDRVANTNYPYYSGFTFTGGSATAANENKLTISNCAAYQTPRNQIGINIGVGGRTVISGCVALSADQTVNNVYPKNFLLGSSSSKIVASNLGAFGGKNTYTSGVMGILLNGRGSSITDSFACGCAGNGAANFSTLGVGGAGLLFSGLGLNATNVDTFSNYIGYVAYDLSADAINIRDAYYSDTGPAANGAGGADQYFSYVKAGISESLFTYSGGLLSACVADSRISLINHNRDVTTQAIYSPFSATIRNNSNNYRSTSSIAIYPTVISTDCERTISIPCSSGASVRVIGYIKKSHATNISATVVITGLGSSVTPFTKANDTAWEQYDLSATNSSGAGGNFTLTYTANSSSGTTNVVYFDGVPDSPFITKCRHYGFLFDEVLPTRTVNPYTVASETTAAAYTGVTLDNTAKTLTTATGTADTAQKLYDYVQAWCVSDLSRVVPINRAGTLFSLTSGWTVIDPTISGITWGGGNIKWTTTGVKAGSFDSCAMTFTTAGTYNLAAAAITGTIDLINTSGGAVTVELAAGVSYTNTGPNITVTLPQTYATISISGPVSGSRIQLYDTTHSVELYNGTPTFPYTFSEVYSVDRAIRLRVMYQNGATAKKFIDANIGSVTSTNPALAYPVSQEDDSVYNTNGIDGSLVTGVTIDDSLLRVNVATGSISWQILYAYETYWLYTAAGIIDEGRFAEAVDTANYTWFNFKMKNTTSPTVPLVVTGGYGKDGASGTSLAMIDTSGGTVIMAPDHVVPYSSGAEATIAIVQSGLTAQGFTTGRAPNLDEITTAPTAGDNAAAVRAELAAELALIGTDPTANEIAAAVKATLIASDQPIPANITKVAGSAISGAGTEASPWGPAA